MFVPQYLRHFEILICEVISIQIILVPPQDRRFLLCPLKIYQIVLYFPCKMVLSG